MADTTQPQGGNGAEMARQTKMVLSAYRYVHTRIVVQHVGEIVVELDSPAIRCEALDELTRAPYRYRHVGIGARVLEYTLVRIAYRDVHTGT